MNDDNEFSYFNFNFTLREFIKEINYYLKRRFIIRKLYWYIQYRFNPEHQYHKLNTKFKPGYYDPMNSIPAVIFEATSDFIDKAEINWNSDPEHIAAGEVFRNARDWWKNSGKKDMFSYINENKFRLERDKHLQNILTHIDYMWYP